MGEQQGRLSSVHRNSPWLLHLSSDTFFHTGVYGGLDLHGVKPNIKWSRLASTAMPGDTTLTLEDSVTWSAGDEVMLTTTDLNAWHTETFQVTNVVGNVLTLNSSVQHRHIGQYVHSKPSHPWPQFCAAPTCWSLCPQQALSPITTAECSKPFRSRIHSSVQHWHVSHCVHSSPLTHAYTVLCSTDMSVTVSTASPFTHAYTVLCSTDMSVTVSTASPLSHYHSSVQHWHVSHCVHSKPFCSRIHSSVQRYVQKQNVDLNYTLSRIPSKRQCIM